MENIYLKQNPQYNFNQTILYPSAVFSSTFFTTTKTQYNSFNGHIFTW